MESQLPAGTVVQDQPPGVMLPKSSSYLDLLPAAFFSGNSNSGVLSTPPSPPPPNTHPPAPALKFTLGIIYYLFLHTLSQEDGLSAAAGRDVAQLGWRLAD